MAYTTINKPSSYFNTVLFTGNGSNQSITGVGFKPDMVWTKARSNAYGGDLYDSVRGVNKYIYPHLTNAEVSGVSPPTLSSFDTDGFTLGANDNSNQANGITAVSWNWLASNTTTSNTSGSITSTVSANTTSGFSIVSYTGNGSSGATVGHGLGVAPKMIIVKGRNTSLNWIVYHSGIGATQYIELNTTGAAQSQSSYNMFNSTAPTSSLFTLGNLSNTNGNTNTYIAYCFAEIKGFSKFGSYTGNGSSDGTFIYTGFKPAFLMVKRTDASGDNWFLYDNKRPGYNLTVNRLYPNLTNSEDSNADYGYDLLSNGFKVRTSNTGWNASGGTYIYMAFAENPFVTSGGIPVTAR